MDLTRAHLTQAYIHLDNLTHNMALLKRLVRTRSLWPAIKANAYGHGSEIIARHLITLGYSTLCVAHVSEALELVEKGLEARFIILSPTLPENSEYFAQHGFEPVVCTLEQVQGLAAAQKAGKQIAVHLKVDTGMGRVGIRPDQVRDFLERCTKFPEVFVKGIMSHFPRASEEDKSFSSSQIDRFQQVKETSKEYGIKVYSLANSAAIFDLPNAYLDAARPGISIYGLKPSPTIVNPLVHKLKPVLELKTRIVFLKEVPAGTGLSYGHIFHTDKPSLIGSIPLGYGDGVSRLLSNKLELLIHNIRCPQVGQICMDQCLVDLTELRGIVKLGDEVVIIGKQGSKEITADDLAKKIGTINYEIVTNIAYRVPRIAISAKV
jgi:alanine racemase